MSGRWQRMWQDLTGRSDALFVDLLRRQAAIGAEAAGMLAAAQRDGMAPADLRAAVVDLERRGDEVRTELLRELARALTTPIDGADLYLLSGSLDDVLDNLRDFAIEMDAYGAEPDERFVAPLDALREGLEALGEAIGQLEDEVTAVAGPARAAKKANDARAAFHEGMGELLQGESVTMRTLRDRELLRRLDVAGLRLGTAADALISGALKRG